MRRIDADALCGLLKSAVKTLKQDDTKSRFTVPVIESFINVVNSMETVDAVKVVRCKDCRRFQNELNWCGCFGCCVNTDGFCNYGERRK